MNEINEMQEEYDFSEAKRGPVVAPEPGKTRITIRLDNEVIEWFRRRAEEAGGGSYQAGINDALREYIRNRDLENILRRVIREELHSPAA
jgi:uncharacterized protein (DUF4415 family)